MSVITKLNSIISKIGSGSQTPISTKFYCKYTDDNFTVTNANGGYVEIFYDVLTNLDDSDRDIYYCAEITVDDNVILDATKGRLPDRFGFYFNSSVTFNATSLGNPTIIGTVTIYLK